MQLEKVNVLLVDDHPENLLALEAILDSLGQNLVKANSGEQALRCLLNQDFAVILLDVQMPGMDGFETASLIRQRERSRNTPIIFLTAFSTNDTLVFKGYSVGAVDYLLKPIQPEILKSKVAVFIDLYTKTAQVKQQAAKLTAINSELRESEQRFRSLSVCSPVGIFLTDMEGRLIYTNPRYQVISNSKLGENLIDSWLHSVHLEDREQLLTDWSTWIRTGQEYSKEFRLLPDLESRWVHVRSSPLLSDQGNFIGHVGTVEDITERKCAEAVRLQIIREQEARQQAEAANRMKDEFLATVSHELRTPLNSILGWAQLLRTRKFEPKTIGRALETIERNAKSQKQLIEDILDVSRIIRGKIRLNLCPVKLIPIIEAAMDALRPAAENKSIQMETVLDPSVPLVSGDPDRLQQIIWNLLSNAIKFTPSGGKIEVRLSPSNSQGASALPYALIQISDTGIGISKDFLPFIFDPFRQADGTTTRAHGGLGLGLAIVRHLVELHGGTVGVNSNGEGQGATFGVQLPLLKSTQGLESVNGDASSSYFMVPDSCTLTGLRVLIVDDDTDTRDFLTTALQQYEANVLAATMVSEALEKIQTSLPDILVSDIGMPEQDGYDLIRQVRALAVEQGGNIPAIALTAYANTEEGKRAISAGFQMYASKPIEPDELIAMVAKLAGRCQSKAEEQKVYKVENLE